MKRKNLFLLEDEKNLFLDLLEDDAPEISNYQNLKTKRFDFFEFISEENQEDTCSIKVQILKSEKMINLMEDANLLIDSMVGTTTKCIKPIKPIYIENSNNKDPNNKENPNHKENPNNKENSNNKENPKNEENPNIKEKENYKTNSINKENANNKETTDRVCLYQA